MENFWLKTQKNSQEDPPKVPEGPPEAESKESASHHDPPQPTLDFPHSLCDSRGCV